jgi:hypothetical protein
MLRSDSGSIGGVSACPVGVAVFWSAAGAAGAAAVIEGVQRAPRRVVALNGIAKAQTADIEAGIDRHRGIGRCILAVKRDELVLGIDP